MKEYNRLTKWEYPNCASVDGSSPLNTGYAVAINRLAELEDKIENGTLKEEKTCVYQEYNDGDWDYWACSNCEEPFCFNNECTPEENQYHYCPNCGAKITAYKEMQEDDE